jgi:hypothetical protein
MHQIDEPKFQILFHDHGIKEVVVRKDCRYTAEDVWRSVELGESHSPGKRFGVLMRAEEGAEVSGEARRAAASERYREHADALALCSSNLMQSIAGNLFVKINRPKVPTRFFDDREKAMAWLKERKEAG